MVEKSLLVHRHVTFEVEDDGVPEPVDHGAYVVVDEERWDPRWECASCCKVLELGDGIQRLPGCDGAHGGSCRGETWSCAGCSRTPCYAEGSDDLPELCDQCWDNRRRARA